MFTLGECLTDQRVVSISSDILQIKLCLNKKPCLEKIKTLRENCHVHSENS